MDLTIDQLAQRVAMTARNIREWQTLGLVPPPEKRGRVGIYSDEHIAIINHVKNLKSQGFPLDVIRRVIDSGSGSEDSVRKMVTEALSPFANGEPVVMPRAELIKRIGAGADSALADTDLVSEVDAATVSIRDSETLDAIELLVSSGMTLSRIAETLREVDRLQPSDRTAAIGRLRGRRLAALRRVRLYIRGLGKDRRKRLTGKTIDRHFGFAIAGTRTG